MVKKGNKEQFAKVDIILTAAELNMLNGESPELWKLYICLSQLRDFASGISGKVTRINDAKFKEMMEVSQKQGRQRSKPSTRHIERWLCQLENLGLIESLGNNVFKLPFAASPETAKKKCHQSVTRIVTTSVTKSEDAQVIENKEENSTFENEVSPKVSPQVALRLVAPLNNNYTKLNYTNAREKSVDNFLTPAENQMLNLFTDLGLSLKLAGDLKAITTAKALISAGVTLEVASEALKVKLNSYTGDRAPHPSYFLQAILDYHRDLTAINSNAAQQEVTQHVIQTSRPKQPSVSEQLRQRRAAWRAKCEAQEQEQDGCEDDRDFI